MNMMFPLPCGGTAGPTKRGRQCYLTEGLVTDTSAISLFDTQGQAALHFQMLHHTACWAIPIPFLYAVNVAPFSLSYEGHIVLLFFLRFTRKYQNVNTVWHISPFCNTISIGLLDAWMLRLFLTFTKFISALILKSSFCVEYCSPLFLEHRSKLICKFTAPLHRQPERMSARCVKQSSPLRSMVYTYI